MLQPSIRRQICAASPPLVFHYVGGGTAERSAAAMNHRQGAWRSVSARLSDSQTHNSRSGKKAGSINQERGEDGEAEPGAPLRSAESNLKD